MPTMRPTGIVTLTWLAVAVLSGCAADPTEEPTPTQTASPSATRTSDPVPSYPPARGESDIDLTVTFIEANAIPAETSRLVCEGQRAVAGTTRQDGDGACSFVRRHMSALSNPIESEDCDAVFGGSKVADVFGTIDGALVRASFKRTDSCQIDAWDTMAPLIDPNVGGTEE